MAARPGPAVVAACDGRRRERQRAECFDQFALKAEPAEREPRSILVVAVRNRQCSRCRIGRGNAAGRPATRACARRSAPAAATVPARPLPIVQAATAAARHSRWAPNAGTGRRRARSRAGRPRAPRPVPASRRAARARTDPDLRARSTATRPHRRRPSRRCPRGPPTGRPSRGRRVGSRRRRARVATASLRRRTAGCRVPCRRRSWSWAGKSRSDSERCHRRRRRIAAATERHRSRPGGRPRTIRSIASKAASRSALTSSAIPHPRTSCSRVSTVFGGILDPRSRRAYRGIPRMGEPRASAFFPCGYETWAQPDSPGSIVYRRS